MTPRRDVSVEEIASSHDSGLPEDESSAGTPASRLIGQLQPAYITHPGRLIAASRMICAILLLVLLAASPFAVIPSAEADKVCALAFAGLALVALIISLTNWYLDFTLAGLFVVIDLLTFLFLVTSHTINDAAPAAAVIWLMAHIQFAAVKRWGMPAALLASALILTVWIADIVVSELPRGEIDVAAAVRLTIVVLAGSAIVLWASRRLSIIVLPRFNRDIILPGLPQAASAFGYAMRMSGASGAALCWIDRDSAICYGLGAGALADTVPPTPTRLGFGAAKAFRKLMPMIFDLSHGRAIVAGNENRVLHAVAPAPGTPLLGELGIVAGICVPIDVEDQRVWLVLTGIPQLGWGHLQLANAISTEITGGISWQIAAANARNTALMRLRRTLASDLHDSVAHSLAGAKFLLVALRSKISANAEICREIDSIKEALETEHQHVRKVIEQLRQTTSGADERDLIDDFEIVLQALALQWQIDAELTDSDFRMQVPVLLSLEMQQIVREAVGNAVRHGRATRVMLKCRRNLGQIRLEVMDNGSGFPDPENPIRPRSISERVSELGGTLDIATEPGMTMLRMSIPSPMAE